MPTLNLGRVVGDRGPQGIPGPKGEQGIQGVAGPAGKDGVDGENGAPGKSATIEIGTVTTGEPGTEASVSNSGSSNDAVFNFTIPRGEKGDRGDQGPAGPTGPEGAPGRDGVDGSPGTPGANGADGKSAYQAAVSGGYTGSETDFNNALAGINNIGGKRVARFIIGTSTAGWTSSDCDYLCDGTNDQVEINAAIQALPSAGGEIIVLDGTYNIKSTIILDKGNVKISGTGKNTVFKRMYNKTESFQGVITITAQSGFCYLQDFSVDGNKANYSGTANSGIALDAGDECYVFVSGIVSQENGGNGIVMQGYNTATVNKSICVNNGKNGISARSSKPILCGNFCGNNGGHGISLEFAKGASVSGNICFGNTASGIYISGDISGTNDSGRSSITGNACNENNIGIMANGGYNEAITGNSCNKNTEVGIWIANSCYCTVSGNVTNNNDVVGIKISSSENCAITCNVCLRGEGTSSDYSSSQKTIYSSRSEYCIFSSNLISGKNYTEEYGTSNEYYNNKYN